MAGQIPGTPTAAYLGFALVDELIDTLISRDVIPADERSAIIKRVLARIEGTTQSAAKDGAEFIRRGMLPKE